MEEYLSEYENYLKRENLSANTLENYKRDVKLFMEYIISKNLDIKDVTEEWGNRYVIELKNTKKSVNTIKRNISSLKKFYSFLVTKGEVNINPFIIKTVGSSKRIDIKYLTYDEIEKLIDAPDENTVKGIRDKAMIEIMYGTGIKVTELINLKLDNINLKDHFLLFNKSEEERFIPIGRYCVNIMKKYLSYRKELDKFQSEYVFLNVKGEPLTRQGFWKIIKEYAKEINIDKEINCTVLRHSFAMHLLENGADISVVQELLGLTYLNSAEVYKSAIKNRKIVEQYIKNHPRA